MQLLNNIFDTNKHNDKIGHAPSNQGTSRGAATGSRIFACPNCGTEVEESNKFCPGCGNKVEIPEDKPRFCGNCGAEIIEGAKFC